MVVIFFISAATNGKKERNTINHRQNFDNLPCLIFNIKIITASKGAIICIDNIIKNTCINSNFVIKIPRKTAAYE